MSEAIRDALRSGAAGSAAMATQVTALMWLRTTVNYQYRHGGGTRGALRALYADGGVRRFYRGYPVALLHAPLARFGDVASYSAAHRLESLPAWQQTALATGGSSAWKLLLMPLDTLKTSMQVHGDARALGYYPWFFTYGWLDRELPACDQDTPVLQRLGRHAGMGFAASAASDTVSNAARVVKVCRQTHPTSISYMDAARRVISEDGVRGLLGRGLRTKILANGVQGATFSVAWKCIESWWRKRKEDADPADAG